MGSYYDDWKAQAGNPCDGPEYLGDCDNCGAETAGHCLQNPELPGLCHACQLEISREAFITAREENHDTTIPHIAFEDMSDATYEAWTVYYSALIEYRRDRRFGCTCSIKNR